MNLFFIDIDPTKCAQYHCNKHVIKMLLESVQLLYTAHNILKTKNMPDNSYKSVSINHPIAIWVRTSKENYIFTVTLAIELSKEYTYRYNKIHKWRKTIF